MSRKRDGARNFFPMPQKIFNLGMNAGEIAVYPVLHPTYDGLHYVETMTNTKLKKLQAYLMKQAGQN